MKNLLSSPSQGIVELVKNAYDANATTCVVSLRKTKQEGGCIEVRDNGDGMTREEILRGWLVLGKSGKNQSLPTRLGRIPAGNKGLGRLSAMRLGREAVLTTHPRLEPGVAYRLRIDWQQFEQAEVVEDVLLKIKKLRSKRQDAQGTILKLLGLRSRIGRSEVKSIARALILLADPFSDDPGGFLPSLMAPEYRDLEELVSRRYFGDADYHLITSVDEKGHASARVVDWKGNLLFSASHETIRGKKSREPYSCPPAFFELWVYILQKSTFVGRNSTIGEVKRWLSEFGGVHLYEGSLRVAPYGNPGNDWLDMNLARTRSPEERPSTNTSIGRVRVAAAQNMLVQKTDRAGFVETEAFQELRVFCKEALDWMHRERLGVAEKRRAMRRAEATTRATRQRDRVEAAIQGVSGEAQSKVKAAFRAYDRTRAREVEHLQSEIQLYRTLSTAGITAAVFAHEAEGNPLKVVKSSASTLRRRARTLALEDQEKFRSPIDNIYRAVSALQVLGSTTLGLVERQKRRIGRVDVHSVVRRVFGVFTPFLDSRSVDVELSLCNGDPYLRASEAALESVITNLLNNCLTAFDTGGLSDRRIVVKTSCLEGSLLLTMSDSGPGISGIDVGSIWLPGETTRPNGTGLGLTIVRDTVVDLGGTVEAHPHGELGGAEFQIQLPILGV